MDSKSSTGGLEDEMNCSVCQELFKDPVTLKCGHNFCRECVCEYWKGSTIPACSICRADSAISDLITNHTLRNIVEMYKKEYKKYKAQSESVCSEHEEKLKLYCLKDQESICVVCQTSRKHKNHAFLPIEEAAQEFKEELSPAVKHLQGTQEKLSKVKEEYCKHLNHIQDQAQKTEKQINEDFVKLHQFLHEEEKNLLADLKKEKEEKEQKKKEKIKRISEEMTSLSINIKDIEKKMDQGDSFFLMVGTRDRDSRAVEAFLSSVAEATAKNQKTAGGRAAHTYEVPEIPSGALIDVAKYLGNLQHRVWNKMLSIIHPVTVTLDPNTAHPELTLLEDLTAVTWGSTRREDLPDNPKRFDVFPCVLGSEGFTSGRHSWVVDVEKQTHCCLGVTAESATRKGFINLKPEHGYWTVQLYNGGYSAFTDKGEAQLNMLKTPKKVLVCMDYEDGKVSFSHADDRSHIYTFTHKFKHKIFPFFYLLTAGGSLPCLPCMPAACPALPASRSPCGLPCLPPRVSVAFPTCLPESLRPALPASRSPYGLPFLPPRVPVPSPAIPPESLRPVLPASHPCGLPCLPPRVPVACPAFLPEPLRPALP
ncbi:E3 ubiquitin-protein ligase TRIM39-like [Latimeria chalumnae]|uniref:E3 ubiquitin-protein ligase TRIM39-like n=1 Tax=Latimeria chalumnae TaxID=7897 RepID=UPI00313E1F4E